MANRLGVLIHRGSWHLVTYVQIVILSFMFLDDLCRHFLCENPFKITLFLCFQRVAVVHHYHPFGGQNRHVDYSALLTHTAHKQKQVYTYI